MRSTQNSLGKNTRKSICGLLAPRLADAVDLYTQAKQAHWNVRGPNFMQLHELFDATAELADEWADLIAERAAQLGGTPVGTARTVAKSSSLREYPLELVKGDDHVAALSAVLASFGEKVRKAIDQATDIGDPVTADMLTEICRAADKQLWIIESHSAKTA